MWNPSKNQLVQLRLLVQINLYFLSNTLISWANTVLLMFNGFNITTKLSWVISFNINTLYLYYSPYNWFFNATVIFSFHTEFSFVGILKYLKPPCFQTEISHIKVCKYSASADSTCSYHASFTLLYFHLKVIQVNIQWGGEKNVIVVLAMSLQSTK